MTMDYKKLYFEVLDDNQRLREELHSNERAWEETCKILRDDKIMNGIKKSLQQIKDGKSIPLAELKITSSRGNTP